MNILTDPRVPPGQFWITTASQLATSRKFSMACITGLVDDIGASAPKRSRRPVLTEVFRDAYAGPLMRQYGLVFQEHDDKVLRWHHRYDRYEARLYSPWMWEQGLRYYSKVIITGEMLHTTTSNAGAFVEVVEEAVRDAADVFWGALRGGFVAGRFPCHDPPDPDSPAGIYAAAFG